MARIDRVIRQGFVATANAEGRLKGWDDETLTIENDGAKHAHHEGRSRVGTNLVGATKFGAIENIRDLGDDASEDNIEAMADIIRKRRSTSLTYIKGLLGF